MTYNVDVKNFDMYQQQYKNSTSVFKQSIFLDHTLSNSLLENKSEYQKETYMLFDSYLNKKFNTHYLQSNYNWFIDNMNEGLIMTYDPYIFMEKLNTFGLTEYDSYFENNNGALSPIIDNIFYLNEFEKNKSKIEQFINKCGYFISNTHIDSHNTNVIHVQVEPKFITECTDTVYNTYNNKIYHITLGAKYDKIKNNGLIPKAYNKRAEHPERVYFYPFNLTQNQLKLQANTLFKQNNTYNEQYLQYVTDKGLEIILLEIDLSKYNKLKYRFFWDPNHPQGIFTYEPVHPVCVDAIKTIYI